MFVFITVYLAGVVVFVVMENRGPKGVFISKIETPMQGGQDFFVWL